MNENALRLVTRDSICYPSFIHLNCEGKWRHGIPTISLCPINVLQRDGVSLYSRPSGGAIAGLDEADTFGHASLLSRKAFKMFFWFSLSFNYRNRTKKDYEHAGSETTWSDLSKLSEEILNLMIRNWDDKLRIKTRFPPSRRFAEVQEHKRGFCHIFSSVLLRLLRVLG